VELKSLAWDNVNIAFLNQTVNRVTKWCAGDSEFSGKLGLGINLVVGKFLAGN
jgi:hypothetical protein